MDGLFEAEVGLETSRDILIELAVSQEDEVTLGTLTTYGPIAVGAGAAEIREGVGRWLRMRRGSCQRGLGRRLFPVSERGGLGGVFRTASLILDLKGRNIWSDVR